MLHPSRMFWHSRGSGTRLDSIYEVTDYFCFSQLGKRCQKGLLRLGFAPGLIGLGFSWKKIYIIVDTIHMYVFYPFLWLRGGENRWMHMDRFGCHSHLGNILVILSKILCKI
jgi:hypothetical protein